MNCISDTRVQIENICLWFFYWFLRYEFLKLEDLFLGLNDLRNEGFEYMMKVISGRMENYRIKIPHFPHFIAQILWRNSRAMFHLNNPDHIFEIMNVLMEDVLVTSQNWLKCMVEGKVFMIQAAVVYIHYCLQLILFWMNWRFLLFLHLLVTFHLYWNVILQRWIHISQILLLNLIKAFE